MRLNTRGVSLIEILISLAIFSIIVVASGTFINTSIRQNRIVWTGLSSQRDARRAMQMMIDSIRKAEPSSTGAFTIVSASSTEFIFYSNNDTDTLRERIRFSLNSTTLEMGVISPTGSPLTYPAANETTSTLASFLRNLEEATPLFQYYDQSFAGTSSPLVFPVTTTDIRAVGINIIIEENKELSPVPIEASSIVQIRNLKEN